MTQMSTEECVTLIDWDDAEFVKTYLVAEPVLLSGQMTVVSLRGMLATVYALGRKRGRADSKGTVTFIVKDQE